MPNPSYAQPAEEEEIENSEAKLTREEKLFNELLARYESAIVTSDEMETLPIKDRAKLMGVWLREGDLGFIHGERGSGKTWFSDAIAVKLTGGEDLDSWEVPQAVDVLLVDGEMPSDDTRNRLKGMQMNNKRLHVLHHEVLFDKTGLSMNFTEPLAQRVISELCSKKKIKVLILDNLSCLFSGIAENDADAWELVLSWLLNLRRRRIAVIFIHHSGRSGQMRGTSKREDNAFWVIKVERTNPLDQEELGAHFETSFTKQRNSAKAEWIRQWSFQTESDGSVSIGCKEIGFEGKVLQLIQDGVDTASAIAREIGCVPSTVSKAASRLENKKLINVSNRRYSPRGFMKEKHP